MNKTKRAEHERLALELDPEDPLVLSDLGGKAFERGNYVRILQSWQSD